MFQFNSIPTLWWSLLSYFLCVKKSRYIKPVHLFIVSYVSLSIYFSWFFVFSLFLLHIFYCPFHLFHDTENLKFGLRGYARCYRFTDTSMEITKTRRISHNTHRNAKGNIFFIFQMVRAHNRLVPLSEKQSKINIIMKQ